MRVRPTPATTHICRHWSSGARSAANKKAAREGAAFCLMGRVDRGGDRRSYRGNFLWERSYNAQGCTSAAKGMDAVSSPTAIQSHRGGHRRSYRNPPSPLLYKGDDSLFPLAKRIGKIFILRQIPLPLPFPKADSQPAFDKGGLGRILSSSYSPRKSPLPISTPLCRRMA